MVEIPDGSIYFWMYTQGLRQVPLDHILSACSRHGKDVRQKDLDNYWNGWYRSNLYVKRSVLEFPKETMVSNSREFFEKGYEDYDLHPYLGLPEIEQRYVPCNAANKPMIKWSDGCLSKADALAFRHSKYLGENVRGCKFIVFDCDGDHTDDLDLETIEFMWQFSGLTHCMMKPKTVTEYDGYEDDSYHSNVAASFHLTFRVDREIPTMHFMQSHIDIVGNKRNSLRYFKNKIWNGKEPIDMTPEIWEKFKAYIRTREEA